MKVQELIEELSKLDKNAEVYFSYEEDCCDEVTSDVVSVVAGDRYVELKGY